jgi:hypothetical protein
MPKTLTMTRDSRIRMAQAPGKRAQIAAIALFLLAYLAILGVLFAPEGFFLATSEPVVLTE